MHIDKAIPVAGGMAGGSADAAAALVALDRLWDADTSDDADIDAVVGACAQWGADALHPGYGFLSENPALARACADAGVTFIGPPPEAGELMGDKLRAKEAAAAAGVPVVPSFTEDEARAAGARDAYPLLVKAAAGGGGRGMRIVAAPRGPRRRP